MEAFLKELLLGLQGPLLIPACVGAAVLLATVVLFHSLSKPSKGRRKKDKKENMAGGTVFTEEGLRRSTRTHKTPVHFSDEFQSPAPQKTPRAARTPRASKVVAEEGETETPRRRTRQPRTPKAEAPAEQAEPTPHRRGRPPKAAAE